MIRFSSGGGGFDPCGMAVPLMESVIPKKIKMWNSMDIRIRFSSGSRGFDPCVMAVHEFTLRWRHFIVRSDSSCKTMNTRVGVPFWPVGSVGSGLSKYMV